jgi:hypothetical protein
VKGVIWCVGFCITNVSPIPPRHQMVSLSDTEFCKWSLKMVDCVQSFWILVLLVRMGC